MNSDPKPASISIASQSEDESTLTEWGDKEKSLEGSGFAFLSILGVWGDTVQRRIRWVGSALTLSSPSCLSQVGCTQATPSCATWSRCRSSSMRNSSEPRSLKIKWRKNYRCFSFNKLFLNLWDPSLQHARLLCPPLSPRVCSSSCPLSQWC